MLPIKSVSPTEFCAEFPPRSKRTIKTGINDPGNHRIWNDVPSRATRITVYEHDALQNHNADVYPIPSHDQFSSLRKLNSLEAVVKQVSPGNALFSHMLVDPEDVAKLFGESFMEELREIQRDVSIQYVFVC